MDTNISRGQYLSSLHLVNTWPVNSSFSKHRLLLSGEGMAPRFLSHNEDLEWRTLKPPLRVTALRSWIDRVIALRSWMDRVIALRRISVTTQCYSSILFRRQQENPSSRHEDTSRQEEKSAPARGGERERERERERAGSGSSICMFISPWACLM